MKNEKLMGEGQMIQASLKWWLTQMEQLDFSNLEQFRLFVARGEMEFRNLQSFNSKLKLLGLGSVMDTP